VVKWAEELLRSVQQKIEASLLSYIIQNAVFPLNAALPQQGGEMIRKCGAAKILIGGKIPLKIG